MIKIDLCGLESFDKCDICNEGYPRRICLYCNRKVCNDHFNWNHKMCTICTKTRFGEDPYPPNYSYINNE